MLGVLAKNLIYMRVTGASIAVFLMSGGKHYACPLVASAKIQEASLHVRKPWKQRLYVMPFAGAYSVWLLLLGCLTKAGAWDELWYVPLCLIMVAHFLTFMACNWSVKVDAFVTCRPVKALEQAELVLVVPREHGGKATLVPIVREAARDSKAQKKVSFTFQRQKFLYDPERKTFTKTSYPIGLSLSHYVEAKGLGGGEGKEKEKEEEKDKLLHYGMNRFDVPLPSFMELFQEHATAPFFVFQVFCVALWCLDEYWYYSLFTLLMLVVFESTVVQQRLKSMQEFRSMSLPNLSVLVCRGGVWKESMSEGLLPGDLVVLEYGGQDEMIVPCDLVLLAGTCIVNEAMISGESTPMLKESLGENRQSEEMSKALDLSQDRQHVLFGGTKILQVSEPNGEYFEKYRVSTRKKNVFVAYVLRTGFSTLQGKLIRTMMFTSERMTANNLEAFAFILFLLVFAIAAAGYVLYHTWADESRSRFKLLLECTLIITAVVPPELPMELSLAVNNSLMALSKFAIFCMEPFRIPLAGKLDVCCFDKTGTLTGENLVVQGVAGFFEEEKSHETVVSDGKSLPLMSSIVIATCHSLFKLDGAKPQIVGDPMEKTALEFVDWTVVGGDQVASKSNPKHSARILHRFKFSSTLKRMSCVFQFKNGESGKSELFLSCKGAPEVVEEMLKMVPSWYREAFTNLAHSGARVLCLAYKRLPADITVERVKRYSREQAEGELNFAGFLIFHCPLKPDSKAAVKSLIESLHHVVMITGDNALTAIHTAYDLELACKPIVLLDQAAAELASGNLKIEVFQSNRAHNLFAPAIDFSGSTISKEIFDAHDFAITGDAAEGLDRQNPALFNFLLPKISVFARSSPSQKELILTRYKSLGFHTLMCGDGTNDVGALKQAHVGLALLDGKPEDLPKIMKQMQTVAMKKRQIAMEKSRLDFEKRYGVAAHANADQARQVQERMQRKIEEMSLTLEEEEVPMVRLGDASVAAPFTSKISTVMAVCNIVRQGRCTLVTTMQMYKILALNSLISAYGLSVLHLEGIRYGDFQVTVTGMLLAGCFLFLSKSQPIEKLAAKRPQPNIFNWYVLLSVLLQFFLHVSVLYYILSGATRWSFRMKADENTKFVPGLINTAVFLLSLLMQVSTFVVNYQV